MLETPEIEIVTLDAKTALFWHTARIDRLEIGVETRAGTTMRGRITSYVGEREEGGWSFMFQPRGR